MSIGHRVSLGERTSTFVAWMVAFLVLCPILGIGVQGILGLGNGAGSVFTSRLIPLLANTLILAIGTSVLACAIGLSGAWVLNRYRFRGQSVALALLVSPLAIPPYVVAQLWLEATGPGMTLQGLRPIMDIGRLPLSIIAIGLCTSPLCLLNQYY